MDQLTDTAVYREDTALRILTQEDRDQLAMDAWEPSLLRKLLQALDRLPPDRGRAGDGSA